jgi:hypothetical protein
MANRDDLREVLIKESDDASEYKIKGYFHQWGQCLIETRSDPEEYMNDVPITIGIVEVKDGQIWKIDPFRIKFVV